MRHREDRTGAPGAAGLRLLGDRLRRAAGRPLRDGDLPVLVLPDVAPGTRILLGRSRASDVRFLEPTVSRRHAALQRVRGGWLLVDRASTHGTWVNERRIDRAIVADGDRIGLGGARMVVRI
jgi:pSer/pThr/pTyr-binding forkhead associated (FHA) protein